MKFSGYERIYNINFEECNPTNQILDLFFKNYQFEFCKF